MLPGMRIELARFAVGYRGYLLMVGSGTPSKRVLILLYAADGLPAACLIAANKVRWACKEN